MKTGWYARRRPVSPPAKASLGAYLQQITLLTDADQKDPDADTVKLMTIHRRQGTWFSCVFAAGLEGIVFPNAMAINTRGTGRKKVVLCGDHPGKKTLDQYANTRYKFGPDRFKRTQPFYQRAAGKPSRSRLCRRRFA